MVPAVALNTSGDVEGITSSTVGKGGDNNDGGAAALSINKKGSITKFATEGGSETDAWCNWEGVASRSSCC